MSIQQRLAGIEPRPGSITPRISEAQAVDLASALLAEGVVYSIGGLVIVYEYQRNVTNEHNRIAQQKEQMQEMKGEIQSLSARIEKIEEEMLKRSDTPPGTTVPEEPSASLTEQKQRASSGWLWRRSPSS